MWCRFAAGVVLAGQLLTAAIAAGQYTVTPDTGAPGPGGTKFNVSLVNQVDASIQFTLRPKAGTWATYTLDPNEKSVYSCYGCGGIFEVSIRTGGTTVTYDVNTGKLYAIRLNRTRNIYDLYEVQ